MFEGGLIVLPTIASWLAAYEEEIVHFPNTHHDDQVDSTTQFLEWARKRMENVQIVHT